MKRLTRLSLSAACLIPLVASTAYSDNHRKVRSNAASYEARLVARALFAPPRTQRLRPFERVILNTNVYRYEGNGTIDHDLVSSPEIIFHTRNGRVRAGHDWDTRD